MIGKVFKDLTKNVGDALKETAKQHQDEKLEEKAQEFKEMYINNRVCPICGRSK